MACTSNSNSNLELHLIKDKLAKIQRSIHQFRPLTSQPPILDSSIDVSKESPEDTQWLQQEPIPGLKRLKDSISMDLEVLNEFLNDPKATEAPTLSTNAPYLIAVWNEILCAPWPITSILKPFSHIPSGYGVAPKKKSGHKPQGTKVDVVADNGKRWIRVNTIKNARLLAEFREIDSYFTDSGDEFDDAIGRPSLAQTEFVNSVIRMGRSLLEAAAANPIEGMTEIPKVTMRLTRLALYPEDKQLYDPRIEKTVQCLEEMGISVELGERGEIEPPASMIRPAQVVPAPELQPTGKINLDLSVLIALVSDLTHARLPTTIEEARKRFIPPKSYREWKQKRLLQSGKNSRQPRPPSLSTIADATSSSPTSDVGDMPGDLVQHSRALTTQIIQEMARGLIDELHHKLYTLHSHSTTEFWTTNEARDRCLRIISKIGGPNEKRRAHALFYETPSLFPTKLSLHEAEELYWQGSRYERSFLSLFPLRFYPRSSIITPDIPLSPSLEQHPGPKSPFFASLAGTCKYILSHELIPHPKSLPEDIALNRIDAENSPPSIATSTSFPVSSSISTSSSPSSSSSSSSLLSGEIQRAIVTKVNPRLTAHTVQSLLYGAELGWTTLTANRSSVKAILREIKAAMSSGRLGGGEDEFFNGVLEGEGRENGESAEEARRPEERAAVWVVDPRSLAEGMSSFAMA